jgi:hypothetical protein
LVNHTEGPTAELLNDLVTFAVRLHVLVSASIGG